MKILRFFMYIPLIPLMIPLGVIVSVIIFTTNTTYSLDERFFMLFAIAIMFTIIVWIDYVKYNDIVNQIKELIKE